VPFTLGELLEGIAMPAAEHLPGADLGIADLALDSRSVRPGTLFFAVPGHSKHGLRFVADAVARGAVAVLWDPAQAGDSSVPPELPPGVFGAAVPHLTAVLGRIADRFFGHPSAHLRICAVTGTNGKTTCAYLLAQCLEHLGAASAYVGTLGIGRVAALAPATHTTPDVVSLHRALAGLRAAGITEVAIEASSHALAQDRLAAVRIFAAAFTNLTRDHLDYHGTMAAYGEAKARLFTVPGLQHAIVNVGDPQGAAIGARLLERTDPAAVPRLTAVRVGDGGSAAAAAPRRLRATEVRVDADGLDIDVEAVLDAQAMQGGRAAAMLLRVRSSLLGAFNAENLAIVLGLLLALDVPPAAAVAALGHCTAAPGRMEVIRAPDPGKPLAVIDYAHTPDALAKTLTALRAHCRGTLWCVFGCGGDRDPGKRPIMGRIADDLADRIIVTDDNPRGEDPAAITLGIASGITVHRPLVIHDRGAAINAALAGAAPSDVVLIAGKGHEDYQIYGSERRAFSDRLEAMRRLGVAA
jgi:UDP-N-acetylmuramoyl-L-alanyl-D-glutamate--2,6-diaminopimelate ligase